MPSVLAATSRLRQTPVLRQDSGERFLEWRFPRYGIVAERLYVVTESDLDRPDLIAHRMYGLPDYWWVILDYNQITDPFTLQVGDRLRIPQWGWPGEFGPVVPEVIEPSQPSLTLPPLPPRYQPPPHDRPDAPAVEALQAQQSTVFNLAILVPECLVGTAHFEVQIASDGLFTDVILSRFTATSNERWFYYDPFTQAGLGGHLAFPPGGLEASIYAGQPVYFRVLSGDGLVAGVEYFPRFRVLIDDQNSPWQGLPPIISPAD